MLACAFSPTRDRIGVAMHDHSVRVFVSGTGARVGVMRGHLHPITCCGWSPDGYHLATGSVSGEVRVWLPHIIAKRGPQPQHGYACGPTFFSECVWVSLVTLGGHVCVGRK